MFTNGFETSSHCMMPRDLPDGTAGVQWAMSGVRSAPTTSPMIGAHCPRVRPTAARSGIRRSRPGGGYIMGATHSLSVGAKVENALGMKRCRDEWGRYPIDPRRFT